jgi:hypothetical protein
MNRVALLACSFGALLASAGVLPADAAATSATTSAVPVTVQPAPAAGPPDATTSVADSIAAAVLAGKPALAFRLRYEGVTDDSLPRDADAVTLRTRVGWQSGALAGMKASLEVDDVRALVDDYNAVAYGDPARPIVADPKGAELKVATLTWSGGTETLAVGRQRIAFDDQRFVGTVAWRDNEQTCDALQLRTRRLPRTEFAYAYVANVSRIYGPTGSAAQPANWHGDTHFLNAKVDAGAAGTVVAFAYLLRFDNAAAASNDTYGLRWTGKVKGSGAWSFPFAVSFATQREAGRNAVPYSGDYSLVEAGVARGDLKLQAGREVLSGDATRAGHRFQTPLATLHAFDGWADKFLATPPQGLVDTYATFGARAAGIDVTVAFHDFRAEAVSRPYGTEWDVQATRRFAGRYDVLAKVADYRADGFARDTRKVWLQFATSF